ncbi:glutathione S-transferase family protein [Aureimonas frigidaquae]|uniref:glutathione S-transferase family protein n=1 Tax=Aureimonas frigidaquae TaxID=424757 RepID=UPI0007813314|nr:glutathione S-transferase family protein [Aureimonas frigidaquae]
MADLTFYTNPMSRGRIVRWMLEEAGVPYDTELVDYGASGMKSTAYRVINPMGKVPAIRHGETIVTECAAICAYLADAFPEAGLAPDVTSPARGSYYRWLFFAAGPLEQAVTNRALGFVAAPEHSRMLGYGSYEDVLSTIEGAVSGRQYLAGDRFSVADLYVGAQLSWGMMSGRIEKRPAFEAYADPLMARPAAVRAREIDGALAPPRD